MEVEVLLPLLALQLAFQMFSLYDLWKSGESKGRKMLWSMIILFLGVIGPIIYYAVGRR